MNKIIFAALIAFSAGAHAETELACMVDGKYVSVGRQTETVASPEGESAPELLGKRSPFYKGDNSYDLEKIDHHTYNTANYKNEGDLSVQLILPTDLSSDVFKTYRIRVLTSVQTL